MLFWMLILGGGYYLYKNPKANGTDVGANPVSGQNAQPSQIHPQRNFIFDPRVDNQNQPWYQGSQTAIQDAANSNLGASSKDLWSGMDMSKTNQVPIQNGQLIHPDIQAAFNEGTQIFGGKY